MSLLGLRYKVKLAWGIPIRFPYASGFQLGPILPPPSTIIGSVIEPVAIRLGLGELVNYEGTICSPIYAFKDAFKAAALGLSPESEVGLIVKGEVTKLVQIPYLSDENARDPRQWFTAQAIAAVYGPGAVLDLAVVVDLDTLAKRYEEVSGKPISEGDLEEVLKTVVPRRLGAKEGLIFIRESSVGEANECVNCETYLYAPEELWIEKPQPFVNLDLWELTKSSACVTKARRGVSLVVQTRRYVAASGPLSSSFVLTPPPSKNFGSVKSGYCIEDVCVGGGT
ncbi:hypothetical protein EYM_02735 [Ignicoccus islandicus DSM 13165]|uniref:CRISPR-associated protein Cas5 n=1 Tax=Ignicoccus islandicus DSM 13165 TaxID=940295 RepID=A0A0U2VEA3_9CREN|nr:hypothetical protein [Ignicoccus islandicus]ALU12354.1 hypothetical protein EYM_02735 [Ignicoccus islandicus DSM 13165]